MNASLFALLIVPFVLLISVLYIWRWRHTSDNRRSPINDKLLRAPGEWLMEQKGNLDEKISLRDEKEIELLKVQIEEIKVKASNPLAN